MRPSHDTPCTRRPSGVWIGPPLEVERRRRGPTPPATASETPTLHAPAVRDEGRGCSRGPTWGWGVAGAKGDPLVHIENKYKIPPKGVFFEHAHPWISPLC